MYCDPPLSLYSDPRPLNPDDWSPELEESGIDTVHQGAETGRGGVAKADAADSTGAEMSDTSTEISPLHGVARCDSGGDVVAGVGEEDGVTQLQLQPGGQSVEGGQGVEGGGSCGSTLESTGGGEGLLEGGGHTVVHTADTSPLTTIGDGGEATGATGEGGGEGGWLSRHQDFHESLHTFCSDSATVEQEEGVEPGQVETTPTRIPGSHHTSAASGHFSHEDEHLTASPNLRHPGPSPASMVEILPMQKNSSNPKQSGSSLVAGLLEAAEGGGRGVEGGGRGEEGVKSWDEQHIALTQ